MFNLNEPQSFAVVETIEFRKFSGVEVSLESGKFVTLKGGEKGFFKG
jgi:hypothetical protein